MSAGAISGAGAGLTESSSGRFGELASEDFIKIMLSELSNQDPFNPQDSSALLDQLSSLRNIESQLSLQNQIKKLVEQSGKSADAQLAVQQQLTSLVLQNQLTSAGGLIDKFAMGMDANNDLLLGVVTSVRVENGKVRLELDTGQELPMERVTRIDDSPGGLVGKLVSGLDETNQEILGVVTGIGERDGKPTLELNTGKVLDMDRVTLVTDAPKA